MKFVIREVPRFGWEWAIVDSKNSQLKYVESWQTYKRKSDAKRGAFRFAKQVALARNDLEWPI